MPETSARLPTHPRTCDAHGHANVCQLERRCIVHAVARHGGHLTHVLEQTHNVLHKQAMCQERWHVIKQTRATSGLPFLLHALCFTCTLPPFPNLM